MGLVWFKVFYLLFATTASLATLEGNESNDDYSIKQNGIQLNVHHVQGPGSTLGSPLPLLDVLLHDEEHVKSLARRITRKSVNDTSAFHHKSGNLLEPNSAGIPLNSGLSIGSGNYYVKLGLGSPPKYYSMLIDTGSSLTWLQCRPCIIYCHIQVDPIFEPKASKTYRALSCASSECSLLKSSTLNDPACDIDRKACVYTASYGDQSFSMGFLSQDLLSLTPSQTFPSFTYGCGQDNQGLYGKAAGIIGLAHGKLSMLDQLSTKYGNAFSYCLPTSGSPTSGGGFLSIGKIAPSPYKFTPMIDDPRNPGLYLLSLAAITVAGRPLGLSAARYKVPTIIDSGTVITRLPTSIYSVLKQAFVTIMSSKYKPAPAFEILDACFQGTPKSISAVPEIQLIFKGGANLALGPQNILLEVDEGVTCLAIASSSGSSPIAIIGNYQQQTFNVAYDVSTRRIGFAPGGCR
uniref:Protein ASPARTIC PROTEASE IN GUARD CELL 1 n=2 Tax=Rhizophora mucronata TaxID=61149 RepID=A0A2P2IK60_RHIMU